MSPSPGELVALCLGSNSPDSELRLLTALDNLSAVVSVERIASPYRTAPLSPIPQPDFLNTAALVRTALEPDELLATTKALERAAGRITGPRFGPRPLDIDLVLWGERTIDRPELNLPHPRLRERAFFLVPLAEIAPSFSVPPDGRTLAELLAGVDTRGVERRRWRER